MPAFGDAVRFTCLLAALTVAAAGVFLPPPTPAWGKPPVPDGDAVEVQVYTVTVDYRNQPVVYLYDPAGRRFLPIWIGRCEAHAIEMGLSGTSYPRPLTHDLFPAIIEAAGLRVTAILVDELRPLTKGANTGTYFAVLGLQRADGTDVRVDSRPSDAMALAVRLDVPVYVTRKILEQNGVSATDRILGPPPEGPPDPDEARGYY
jgi:bifunctional DNase/RNase